VLFFVDFGLTLWVALLKDNDFVSFMPQKSTQQALPKSKNSYIVQAL
jgi:hypothetical protein